MQDKTIKIGFDLGIHAIKRYIELRLKDGADLDDVYIEIMDMDVDSKAQNFYKLLQKKV